MAGEIEKAAAGLGGKKEKESPAEAKAEKANPAKEAAESGKKKIAEMHIKFHKGGAVVTHKHHPPHQEEKHDEQHVVAMPHEGHLDNLHDHLEQHAGAPNAGEEQLAAGVAPPQGAGAGAPPEPQMAQAAPQQAAPEVA